MSTVPTNRESDRYMLRLPDGMRDRIKAAAESNNRSMNAEIVATLSEKYPEPVDADFEALLDMAMQIDLPEVERFIQAFIDRKLAAGEITEQDIEDGLVPGVSLRKGSKAD